MARFGEGIGVRSYVGKRYCTVCNHELHLTVGKDKIWQCDNCGRGRSIKSGKQLRFHMMLKDEIWQERFNG